MVLGFFLLCQYIVTFRYSYDELAASTIDIFRGTNVSRMLDLVNSRIMPSIWLTLRSKVQCEIIRVRVRQDAKAFDDLKKGRRFVYCKDRSDFHHDAAIKLETIKDLQVLSGNARWSGKNLWGRVLDRVRRLFDDGQLHKVFFDFGTLSEIAKTHDGKSFAIWFGDAQSHLLNWLESVWLNNASGALLHDVIRSIKSGSRRCDVSRTERVVIAIGVHHFVGRCDFMDALWEIAKLLEGKTVFVVLPSLGPKHPRGNEFALDFLPRFEAAVAQRMPFATIVKPLLGANAWNSDDDVRPSIYGMIDIVRSLEAFDSDFSLLRRRITSNAFDSDRFQRRAHTSLEAEGVFNEPTFDKSYR